MASLSANFSPVPQQPSPIQKVIHTKAPVPVAPFDPPVTPSKQHHPSLPELLHAPNPILTEIPASNDPIETLAPPKTPNRHVTFSLPPPTHTSHQLSDSPWLHSPSDKWLTAPTPSGAPTTSTPLTTVTTATSSPENFNFVFQTGTPQTPQTPHLLATPSHHPSHQKGHSPNSEPPNTTKTTKCATRGPAGNRTGHSANDIHPFFHTVGSCTFCVFCQ